MKALLLVTFLASAWWCAQALTPGEVKALQDLRENFNTSSLRWPEGNLTNACELTHEHPYFGIACNTGPDPHVISFHATPNLEPTFVPESIGGLAWLVSLQMQNVRLKGTIPDVFENMTNLETLIIETAIPTSNQPTHLNTTLPTSICHLTSLKTLSILLDYITGTIPASYSQLINLEMLTLGTPLFDAYVSLSGYLPDLDQMKLEALQLRGTSLLGFAPSTALNKLHLQQLTLKANPYFNADITSLSMSRLTLIQIDLSPHVTGIFNFEGSTSWSNIAITSNSLSGKLYDPFWKSIKNAMSVSVIGRNFKGYISPLVGELRKIFLLKLNLELSGSIPTEIGNCTRLTMLSLTSSYLTGPLPSSLGDSPLLQVLEIQDAKGLGEFPPGAGRWRINSIRIVSSGLNGTLPLIMSPNLNLQRNNLVGQLPPLRPSLLELSNNAFTGTIPCTILATAAHLDLSYNQLGPDLAPDCFLNRTDHWRALNLESNLFRAPLPPLPMIDPSMRISMLQISNNEFYGGIPESWGPISVIHADHNCLNGNLDSFFKRFTGSILNLGHNCFNSTIPNLSTMESLQLLQLPENEFSGAVPAVGPKLKMLDLHNNKLDEVLSTAFISSVKTGSLFALDLSWNQLKCDHRASLADLLASTTLNDLKLANNMLACDFNPQIELQSQFWNPIGENRYRIVTRALDISNNQLTGIFDPGIFTSLAVLDISNNNFSGTLPFSANMYNVITQADISNNMFSSDITNWGEFPYLFSFNARGNRLTGTLKLTSMPKLQTLDYSDNRLNQVPDFASIGYHFRRSLKSLSIKKNSLIPAIESLDPLTTGLNRANASAPSLFYTGVVCHFLTFYNLQSITFEFDEDLFNYIQCDCGTNYFGGVPSSCRQCPPIVDLETGLGTGVDSCAGDQLVMAKNSWLVVQNVLEWTDPNDPLAPAVNHPNLPYRFESESCLVLPEQILMQQSNCVGLNLTADDVLDDDSLAEALQRQCAPGSTGRLCSRCICDYETFTTASNPVCYYEKALRCTKCSTVLRPHQYIPLIASITAGLMIILSIIFLVVLRAKRVQRTVPWRKLSIWKRLFHRLLYLVSLGNISILITFIQIFIELTHWDAFAIGGIVKLSNLNASSLGVVCLFPFLSNPTYALITHSYAPLVVLVLIAACIGLAELFSRLISRCSKRSTARAHDSSMDDSDPKSPLLTSDALSIGHAHDEDHTIGLVSGSSHGSMRSDWITLSDGDQPEYYETLKVNYSALALLCTVSISFTRFIYFSSALAAHEFLFSVFDRRTGVWYVQNYPSLRWDESSHARSLSFPIIAIFDFLLPVGFLILCFINRDKSKRTQNMQYYGSLFDTFSHKCYWWEIVIIFKKLSIALVLQGIPSSSVLQATLIITILGGIQLIQMSLQPWRRKIENIADSIASLILIGALLAARAGRYHNSTTSVYYVIAFAVLYVILSLCMIVWQVLFGSTDYQKRLSRLSSENPSESDLEYDTKHYISKSSNLKTLDPHESEASETVSDFEEERPRAPLSFNSGFSTSRSGSSKLLK